MLYDANTSLNSIIEIEKADCCNCLSTTLHQQRQFKNKKRRSPETITPEERETALKKWILEGQSILSRSHQFTKQSSSLGLYSDDGILRLRGRFKNSAMMENQKHQILLRNATSTFMKRIIWNSHKKMMHQGVEATLANVRRKFWIVKGRKGVKAVVRKCVICIKSQGRTLRSPPSPDLPEFRLNYNERTFFSVGIDFAGPIYFRNFSNCKSCSKDSRKSYILTLTCATTPASFRACSRFVRGIISPRFSTIRRSEGNAFAYHQ